MKEVLLVIFAFTLNPQGNVEDFVVMKKAYDTLAECNEVGRNLDSYLKIPEGVKTLSYCVRPDDYKPV